jgi:hypothetical protein
MRRALRAWALEPTEAQKKSPLILWRDPPPLRFRAWRSLPCWLVGHFDIHLDPLLDSRLMWCMRCDKKWLNSSHS